MTNTTLSNEEHTATDEEDLKNEFKIVRKEKLCYNEKRKGGRVVDGTGLENRQVNSFAGSNPVPSARRFWKTFRSYENFFIEKVDRIPNTAKFPVPSISKSGTVAQLVRAWDS